MSDVRWHGRRRPPWWPENEPFPPRGGWGGQSGAMRHYMRRIVGLFVFAGVLAIVGATFVFLLVGSALGAPDLGGAVARALALLLVIIGLGVAGRSLRRLAAPIAEVIEAVGRVADGDLTVTVAERGPRETRRLARSFNAMTARLRSSEDERRRLLADVSHELRTPLSVVRGNLEALIDGVHPPDDEHLRAILDQTAVLDRLIEDLRTLSLAEAGALTLHREPTDLAAVAREVATAFASEAESRGVTVETRSTGVVPDADLDPVRMREILTNLVSNALRYTPSGGRVTIEVSAASSAVTVSVSDTGAGIPPEALARIFDRFYKSAESRGAGLGLAIAKKLVEGHGGSIEATSAVGQGTTIRFTIPVEPPA